jgi:N-acetyl-alpha-D-muramate 1-phosphate uridylyltransferase
VVLAAGEGRRLRPLTLRRPKALCPVGNVALVDRAVDSLRRATGAVAVNAHHGRRLLEAHLEGTGVRLSIEADRALGTAGALGHLRRWIDGRAVLALNADAWADPDLNRFVEAWDGERIAVLVAGDGHFGPGASIAGTLLPWWAVEPLTSEPADLYDRCWRPAAADGRLQVVSHPGVFVDCGTPERYLHANLLAADLGGGVIVGADAHVAAPVTRSVIGDGARVEGPVDASVVWDGAEVRPGEHLQGAIRVDETMTVLVR